MFFYIFLFSWLCEIFIVKNYGLTALFFTPSALIIAVASTGMSDAAVYFAEIRVLDVLIGTAIGLTGIFFINRHAASRRLNNTIAELMRAQSKLSYVLFNGQAWTPEQLRKKHFYPMKMRCNNLNILHQTAQGEIPKPEEILQKNWQLIYELNQLTYLLERIVHSEKRAVLSQTELADLLLIYEQISQALILPHKVEALKVPLLPEFPLITLQIERIQHIFLQRNMA